MRRFRYADVVATLALVLALTGGAYAVKVATKDSVTSRSIKNETITSKDVKNDRLTGTDVKESTLSLPAQALGADSVSSREVKNDSLTGADVNEASLSLPPAPEPGLGVYSSRTDATISVVGSTDGFMAVSGISPGPDSRTSVDMVSPDVDLVASDLYVETPLTGSTSRAVTAQVLADDTVVLSCVLPQVGSPVPPEIHCDSGEDTGQIPARSRLVVRFTVGAGPGPSEVVRTPMVSFAVRPA